MKFLEKIFKVFDFVLVVSCSEYKIVVFEKWVFVFVIMKEECLEDKRI